MATVALTRAWLLDPTNPTGAISFGTTARSDARAVAGEVRRYAGGRLRIFTRAGSAQTLTFTAQSLTPAQVATFDTWTGRLLLFRDVWGRKLYGTYFTIAVTDVPDRSGQHVTVTFQQVSHDEAV